MKRKRQITFEIHETVFYRKRRTLRGFCRHCGESVEILPMETAAASLEIAEEEILRLIEAGGIHQVEIEKGLVCRNSLDEQTPEK